MTDSLIGQIIKISSATRELDGCWFRVTNWLDEPIEVLATANQYYHYRFMGAGLPDNGDVVFGYIGIFPHLVHVSELVY